MRGLRTGAAGLAALVAAGAAVACGGPPAGEGWLVRGARVVDGTGAPGRVADVRIRGDTVAAIGRLSPEPGETTVDGTGLVLAPGFIDTHSHDDRGLADRHPDALAAVSQGVTTVVVGQDGGSEYPLAEWFRTLDSAGVAINVASYVGHGTLRREVMGGDALRSATPAEIDSMGVLLRREMEAGALGLSTGLEYDPGLYATTEEVVSLARVAAAEGGRYISHVRSEDRHLWEAVDEAIRIGREAHVPVQISHIKLAMKALWGEAPRLLARLDSARASGVEVTADVYPYTYWQSTMQVLFPDRDFGSLASAEYALRQVVPADDLRIARFEPDTTYEGRTLSEVARLRDEEPAVTLLRLIEATRAAGDGEAPEESVLATSMSEEDVRALLAWPHSNLCSDGALDGSHPRGFGAFTRFLGRYVREDSLLPLEAAVRKMTSLAAEHVGLEGRGVLRPGAPADLVLFDPEAVMDRATPEAPHLPSRGIVRVWVNGAQVYADGETTAARPGRVLRRESARGAEPSAPPVGEPRAAST